MSYWDRWRGVIRKYNHYHADDGKFTYADDAATGGGRFSRDASHMGASTHEDWDAEVLARKGEVGNLRDRLVMHLSTYDRKQAERAAAGSGRYHNRHALPQYVEAADRARELAFKYVQRGAGSALSAFASAYEETFTPERFTESIARKLQLPLVARGGAWVRTDTDGGSGL